MSDPIPHIFDRYLDQPSTLPVEVRRRVEQACRGEIIQLYALVDLDASLRLCQIWVTLTANYLAVIRMADRRVDEQIKVVPRTRLEKLIKQPGLSCTVVHFLERDEEQPFVTIRYTHRQRGAIGHLVDTETEHQIQEALNRLIAGRTVIAIAHRLSTLKRATKRATRLLVLKEGRLIEQGSHAQLLKIPNGVYRRLHQMQIQLNEVHRDLEDTYAATQQ
jgi:hypothetical protein